MANTLSAAKRARQNVRRRARNAALKSRLRTIHKNFLKALEDKSPDATVVEAAYRRAIKEYDRAWSRNIVNRGHASRHISRLTKRFQAFQAAQA